MGSRVRVTPGGSEAVGGPADHSVRPPVGSPVLLEHAVHEVADADRNSPADQYPGRDGADRAGTDGRPDDDAGAQGSSVGDQAVRDGLVPGLALFPVLPDRDARARRSTEVGDGADRAGGRAREPEAAGVAVGQHRVGASRWGGGHLALQC